MHQMLDIISECRPGIRLKIFQIHILVFSNFRIINTPEKSPCQILQLKPNIAHQEVHSFLFISQKYAPV